MPVCKGARLAIRMVRPSVSSVRFFKGQGRSIVKQQPTRKPFVTPQLKEEASLEGVTLVSGGNPTRGNSTNTQGNLASRSPQGGRTA